MSAVACSGATVEAETPGALEIPYVHPWVSARLDVRVVALDAKDDLDAFTVPLDITDDEAAQLVDPERSRESRFAAAFGGVQRPTLDCFAPGQGAADVWIVGRTGNGGAIRSLELARSTAGREATRCVLSVLAGARGPAAKVGFSYLLHVEPWPVGCTTVDCERLPGLPRVEVAPPVGMTGGAYVDVSNGTMERFRAGLRACYNRALSQEPTLTGSFTLRARIGLSGEVTSVEATNVTGGLASIAACARSRFASIVFPMPEPASGPVEIVFPVRFTTPGGAPPLPVTPPIRALDDLDGARFASLAAEKDVRAALVPRESYEGGPWMVFVERGGRVATVRRTPGEVPMRKHRKRFEIGRTWSLVLDDPDTAFEGNLFDELQR